MRVDSLCMSRPGTEEKISIKGTKLLVVPLRGRLVFQSDSIFTCDHSTQAASTSSEEQRRGLDLDQDTASPGLVAHRRGSNDVLSTEPVRGSGTRPTHIAGSSRRRARCTDVCLQLYSDSICRSLASGAAARRRSSDMTRNDSDNDGAGMVNVNLSIDRMELLVSLGLSQQARFDDRRGSGRGSGERATSDSRASNHAGNSLDALEAMLEHAGGEIAAFHGFKQALQGNEIDGTVSVGTFQI